MKILLTACALWLIAACLAMPARASYAIFIGRNLTVDGSTLLGGTGDEPSSHWLEIVPRATYPAGAKIKVGVTAEANYPGELIEIPQVVQTARYITMNYSEYDGFPAPLTNGGLNEYGVAARDVWSPSRLELQRMTPSPQHGVNYSDLSRLAMERAHTAREAVELVGALIDKYGYATYGGNSHFFADANEGWVLIDFAGGKGLWIAERVGPDEIRMSYPGYILSIPQEFAAHPDRYRGSSNFVSFAVQQGWFVPKAGKLFDVNAVYQGGRGRSPTVRVIEDRLRHAAATAKLDVRKLMDTVRDPLVSGDQNGDGQVAHLRQNVKYPELQVLWVAATGSITAPFVPYWIGVDKVLPEYGKHRYLTHAEEQGFITRDWAIQEASAFPYITFKRLMYYTCEKPGDFLPEVTAALTSFENESLSDIPNIEAAADKLLDLHEATMAQQVLTRYTSARAEDGMRLGESLLASIESRYRLRYAHPVPAGAPTSGLFGRDTEVGCVKLLEVY